MRLLLIWTLTVMSVQHTKAFGPEDLDRFRKMELAQKKLDREIEFAGRVYAHNGCANLLYARPTAKYAVENKIPARLLASVVVVESSCRADAVSSHHAIGLGQVQPHWHPEFDRARLEDPDYNLAASAKILSASIRKYGIHDGVANYNGGDNKFQYADHVLQIANEEKQ